MNNQTVVEEIKSQSDTPLYLWGCGNVAREVWEILSENGVSVKGCVIDVDIDINVFMGLKVERLADVLCRESSLNIVIGHAQYHRKKELELLKNVKNVYCLPNPFKTHENITEEYYLRHIDAFKKSEELFEEALSKKVFRAYIESRVYGNIDAIFDAFTKPMSYFDNDIWELKNEVYVDCGAYNGDTIAMFIDASSGQYKGIYAFEPDHKIFCKMKERIKPYDDGRIHLFEKGLWNKNTFLNFLSDEEQSGYATEAPISDDEHTIAVCKLDDIIKDDVTLIKVNMSGSNLECIEGARRLIQDCRPKIAITVGLTRERLYQIPVLLKQMNPDYDLFLRFNESMPSRICLYAKDVRKGNGLQKARIPCSTDKTLFHSK